MKSPTVAAAYVLLALLFLPSCDSPAGMPEVGSHVAVTMRGRQQSLGGRVTGYDGNFLILLGTGSTSGEHRLRMSDIQSWKK